MINISKIILDYLFPPKCIFCGEMTGTTNVCLDCWKRVTWISQRQCCNTCGRPLKYKIYDVCEECMLDPPVYDKAVSVFLYNDFSKVPILNLKHKDATYLAKTFAGLIFRNLKEYAVGYDVICPVPIHPSKLIKRMYNQSALIAKELSAICAIPYEPFVLEKAKQTLPQEGLSREQRLTNVIGSFRVSQPEKIAGKSVILVDDVITTGATVNECAKMLKLSQVSRVLVASVAKVIRDKRNLQAPIRSE